VCGAQRNGTLTQYLLSAIGTVSYTVETLGVVYELRSLFVPEWVRIRIRNDDSLRRLCTSCQSWRIGVPENLDLLGLRSFALHHARNRIAGTMRRDGFSCLIHDGGLSLRCEQLSHEPST
jgi:hypothetical protein